MKQYMEEFPEFQTECKSRSLIEENVLVTNALTCGKMVESNCEIESEIVTKMERKQDDGQPNQRVLNGTNGVNEVHATNGKVLVPVATAKRTDKKVILNLIKPLDFMVPLTNNFDVRSQLGQFGWHTICGEMHVPFIYRTETGRHVALRIVNQKILPCFFNVFRQELFDLFVLRSYTMTENERRLYNEINYIHCDCAYGLNSFQKGEQLVALDEVLRFYRFLTFCYDKLISKKKELDHLYGFITFNTITNIVPFVNIGGKQCFPTLYFEGDENFLYINSIPVDEFNVSVIRFLMRLQNVNARFEPTRVITLTDVQMYLEKGTKCTPSWITRESDAFTGASRSNESILKVKNVDVSNVTNATGPPLTVFKLVNSNEDVGVYCPNGNVNATNLMTA